MSRLATTCLDAIVLLVCTGAAPARVDAATPLIERAKLFGNPTRAGGQISPDGRRISFVAPRDGVLNVWVALSGDLSAARPLTVKTVRPIRTSFWSLDSWQVLFVNDHGDEENSCSTASTSSPARRRR